MSTFIALVDAFSLGFDVTPPEVSAFSPAPGATGVDPFARISFEIDDTDGNANPDAVTVSVNGVQAVVAGVPQTGFDGPDTEIVPAVADPHAEVTIAQQVLIGATWVNQAFAWGSTVLVEWYVEDDSGNPASGSWTFTVGLPEGGVPPRQKGFLEGCTHTLGEMLTHVGGVRATRVAAPGAAAGDTVVDVESTYGWPASGKLGLGGVVYWYTAKTSSQLQGLYYVSNGTPVSGIQEARNPGDAVLELSRSLGALDQLRRAFLVDYAEGSDLEAVGRNLGVERTQEVGDDDYRAVIRAMAYAPLTTLWAMENVLDALVGVGNYEIQEDLIANPHLVVVRLSGALLSSAISDGKCFLQSGVLVLADSDTAATLPEGYLNVGGVRWADEAIETDCRTERPSADVQVEYAGQADPGTQLWAFQGAAEATEVLVLADDSGCVEFTSLGPAYYRHVCRVIPETSGEVAALISIPATGTLDASNRLQVALVVRDGERSLAVGVENIDASTYYLGFIDESTEAFVGTPTVLSKGGYYDVQVLKRGRGGVTLVVGSRTEDFVDYADFAASADHAVEFGILSTGLAGDPTPRLRYLRVAMRTGLEYWSSRGAAGLVATVDPDAFDSGVPGAFLVGDVGKALDLRGATAPNAQGGTANGRYTVAEVLDSQTVRLEGRPVAGGAVVDSSTPQRVVLSAEALSFPDDLGKVLRLGGSALGNGGDWTIVSLLHPVSLADLGSFDTPFPEKTHICEVAAASFVSEVGLDWELIPAFVDDASLVWELSGAGEFAADVATWRDALPALDGAYPRVLEVLASTVLSAQLLPDATVENIETLGVWSHHPAYLATAWHYLLYYLDRLVAAGVDVQVEYM